jgi:hypothetical protein
MVYNLVGIYVSYSGRDHMGHEFASSYSIHNVREY